MRARNADPARRGGRPKGAENGKTILQRIAQERHPVVEADRRLRPTTVDLLLRILMRNAMSGDLAAVRLLDQFRERYQPVSDGGGYLVMHGYPGTKEEWLADVKAYQDKLWRGTD
ncbi:hypothetical protein GWK16_24530 [Roseomonas sp. JC162]|uniref:DUF5681 domain-containing protein n=1 Tax=Neoroseomonas marina TaxID=1232220 RepID=A0A848EIC3_9PROT|nr:DUF5681 domain-containing protein [Neoroseomonas marina]NMJ44434.1 hypothetical protein [Neoroseomonas marina]